MARPDSEIKATDRAGKSVRIGPRRNRIITNRDLAHPVPAAFFEEARIH
jgi:hypothetical protein